jgi:hypothetical protein
MVSKAFKLPEAKLAMGALFSLVIPFAANASPIRKLPVIGGFITHSILPFFTGKIARSHLNGLGKDVDSLSKPGQALYNMMKGDLTNLFSDPRKFRKLVSSANNVTRNLYDTLPIPTGSVRKLATMVPFDPERFKLLNRLPFLGSYLYERVQTVGDILQFARSSEADDKLKTMLYKKLLRIHPEKGVGAFIQQSLDNQHDLNMINDAVNSTNVRTLLGAQFNTKLNAAVYNIERFSIRRVQQGFLNGLPFSKLLKPVGQLLTEPVVKLLEFNLRSFTSQIRKVGQGIRRQVGGTAT